MNNKAQGLSINAIILIMLGLAVLVILILGFMLGWNKIVPWFGEKENIDTISKACQTACNSENQYAYCSAKRELTDGTNTYKGVTCYILSSLKDFSSYGIQSCSSLSQKCKQVTYCNNWEYTISNTKESVKIVDGKTISGSLGDYCNPAATP
jgi:hypothetical protein